LIKKLEERNELKRDYAGYSRNVSLNEKCWEIIYNQYWGSV
jgi:hypothetical protein